MGIYGLCLSTGAYLLPVLDRDLIVYVLSWNGGSLLEDSSKDTSMSLSNRSAIFHMPLSAQISKPISLYQV